MVTNAEWLCLSLCSTGNNSRNKVKKPNCPDTCLHYCVRTEFYQHRTLSCQSIPSATWIGAETQYNVTQLITCSLTGVSFPDLNHIQYWKQLVWAWDWWLTHQLPWSGNETQHFNMHTTSLVPRPLPDFIVQLWRKLDNLKVAWEWG